ncbi:MAG: ABC transporter ATP-binding protein [Archaeoglobi archaeon]|nr:ABC transporter ATP-binding protein [Archaeoglobi archaeon]TDA25684.1 MAG: ABC transporter ATP-binding protein [Archaeoglobi archaeon]TDA29957.1 MAG: ABC transporter ATP-binding protein [Archaeoglobi archaeon]
MIELVNVKKSFGNSEVLKGISLRVNGEIYGILGPNGSGKTTLMKIVAGIMKPSAGKVFVEGVDVESDPIRVKQIVGYVPETPILYESLTVSELLNLVGKVRGLNKEELEEKVANFARAFEIEDYLDSLIATLSFGNRQKVAIISALLHNPSVLILDEVMNGLDVRSAKILRELLFRFRREGKSILFSTHIMPFAERLCDRVGVIYEGKIVAEGKVGDLKDFAKVKDLEDVFLKLTRGEDISEILSALI